MITLQRKSVFLSQLFALQAIIMVGFTPPALSKEAVQTLICTPQGEVDKLCDSTFKSCAKGTPKVAIALDGEYRYEFRSNLVKFILSVDEESEVTRCGKDWVADKLEGRTPSQCKFTKDGNTVTLYQQIVQNGSVIKTITKLDLAHKSFVSIEQSSEGQHTETTYTGTCE